MHTCVRRQFILASFLLSVATAPAAPRAEHVIILSIDGGKPAVIAQSKVPVLDRLVKEGAHTWTAQTVFPSITLPSHTSMLTGVDIETHQIRWNNWQPGAGFVKVPTIFTEAKQAGLSTAMFVGKEKLRHIAIPGSVDIFNYERQQSGEVTKEDPTAKDKKAKTKEGTVPAKIVAAKFAAYFKEKKPALTMIHFPDTDTAGHKYGWHSPEQIAAFADVDAALAVVRKAIETAGVADKTVLIISADHGGHDKTHGSDSPEDMNIPWIAWGNGVKAGAEIKAPVKTYDTAATALWLLGRPVPASFVGKPVTAAFQ
jgi:predicted AlkP superfamily pyrophosphatase or phosphodiesterase